MLTMLLSASVVGCAAIDRLVAGPEPEPFVSDFCLAVPEPQMNQATAEVIIIDPGFRDWFLLVDGYGIAQCGWAK